MKPAVISASLAFLAMLLGQGESASAGSVQIGLLNQDQHDAWKCNEAVQLNQSQSKSRCANAAFGDTSACGTVVITNDSIDHVKVEMKVHGPGFEVAGLVLAPGIFDFGGPPCEPRTIDQSCQSLAPGHSCEQETEFSPEQSGSSEGHIEVRVTGSGAPLTRTFNLIGTGDYTPELQAADEVRKRHLDDLKKLPYFVRAVLDDSEGDIAIQVQVSDESHIEKAERLAPLKIEGYRVEVVAQIRQG